MSHYLDAGNNRDRLASGGSMRGSSTPKARSERLGSNCLLGPLLDDSDAGKEARSSAIFDPMGLGSQRASTLTMVSTAFGSGVLALPWAFAKCGLVLGTALLIITGMASYQTLLMLADTGYAAKKWNFSEAVESIVGGGLPTKLLQGMIFVNALGCVIGYYVFLGGILPQVATVVGSPITSRTTILVAITVLPLLPLSSLRRISFFRFLSAGALSCMCIVAVYVVCAAPAMISRRGGIDWDTALWGTLFTGTLAEGIPAFLCSFAIFIFSYQAHMNMFAAVFEMQDPNPVRVDRMLLGSVVVESVVYFSIGAFGALSFGATTPPCITDNYPLDDPFANMARVMVAFSLHVALPLNLFGARGIAYDYFYAGSEDFQAPFLQHFLITGVLLVGCLMVAIVEQSIVNVLGVLGGGCELTFMMVYPMLMIKNLQKSGALEGVTTIIQWTPGKTTRMLISLGLLVVLGYASAFISLLSLLKVPGFENVGQ